MSEVNAHLVVGDVALKVQSGAAWDKSPAPPPRRQRRFFNQLNFHPHSTLGYMPLNARDTESRPPYFGYQIRAPSSLEVTATRGVLVFLTRVANTDSYILDDIFSKRKGERRGFCLEFMFLGRRFELLKEGDRGTQFGACKGRVSWVTEHMF